MATASDFLILIVDDEQDLRETVGVAFESRGFNVVLAANGQEAFELVNERVVDLVLSDIRMPRLSGIQFLDLMKLSKPEIPVIFVTGYADITEKEALARGAKALFHKPCKTEIIIRHVCGVLDIPFPTRLSKV